MEHCFSRNFPWCCCFWAATVLIIYYKQISEGFDDRERFLLMEKVGLSKAEIKKAIHSQVLKVFFLPLIMAVIHIAFAFKMMVQLLALLSMSNIQLIFALYRCNHSDLCSDLRTGI